MKLSHLLIALDTKGNVKFGFNLESSVGRV